MLSKEQQLDSAAFRGELEKVKSLCSDPALNVNWQDDGGCTPLFGACQEGHVGVVKYLLSLNGIDPNLPNNEGATPFYVACQNGHKEVVSLLLADPRIDPNRPRNDGATPFLIACQKGHKEVVSLLLADPRIDPNKPNHYGQLPSSRHVRMATSRWFPCCWLIQELIPTSHGITRALPYGLPPRMVTFRLSSTCLPRKGILTPKSDPPTTTRLPLSKEGQWRRGPQSQTMKPRRTMRAARPMAPSAPT